MIKKNLNNSFRGAARRRCFVLLLLLAVFLVSAADARPRVIVTSDGEIDDECSLVRFLLYANEWDIEGIVTSSSQYHWHGTQLGR